MKFSRRLDTLRAFTMIEIAISLAIIGFALVAIIGILPDGMRTQRENREETIINHDASVLFDAIRSGSYGSDDLTNYVLAITNVSTFYDRTVPPVAQNRSVFWYTPSNSSMDPQFPLTNGFRIVGLLSTPKYMPIYQANGRYQGFVSNYNIAIVRSMSGPANEKIPQNNPDVLELGLTYRLISEVGPYGTNHFDATWTNLTGVVITNMTPEEGWRYTNYMVARNLETNMHDLKLLFRWPVRPDGTVGDGRQVFRTVVGGRLFSTNDINWPLYFFEPRNYVRAR